MTIQVLAKRCNDCQQEMPVKDVFLRKRYMVVVVECPTCHTEYASHFPWPNRVIHRLQVRAEY